MSLKNLARFLFITSLFSAAHLFGFEANLNQSCHSLKQQYDKKIESLFHKYQSFNSNLVLQENRPSFYCGHLDEAVYILHGFIGTPEEMSKIATSLKRAGYTVLNDIIPGHGSGAETANAFKETYWQSFVTQNINQLRKTYKKIHFIGFSTGALLVHNYLYENKSNFSAQSVVLYSPFYKPAQAFIDVLNACLNNIIPTFSIKKLYALTRFREVEVALLKTENYQNYLPLLAAEEVVNLGHKVSTKLEQKARLKINTKVLVFLSMSDSLVQYSDSIALIKNSFKLPEFVIYDSEEVPHHLMVNEVSPVADQVRQQSLAFIKNLN